MIRALIIALVVSIALPAQAELYANDTLSLQTITYAESYDIFSFQTKYIAGERIVVVLPPRESLSFKSLAITIGKTPTSYADVVESKQYGGNAFPVWALTESEVLRKVSIIPYSIGFYHDKIAINTGIGIRIIPIK